MNCHSIHAILLSSNITSGNALFVSLYFIGSSGSDDLPAERSAARSHIHDIVRISDHIQRMQGNSRLVKNEHGIGLPFAHLAYIQLNLTLVSLDDLING